MYEVLESKINELNKTKLETDNTIGFAAADNFYDILDKFFNKYIDLAEKCQNFGYSVVVPFAIKGGKGEICNCELHFTPYKIKTNELTELLYFELDTEEKTDLHVYHYFNPDDTKQYDNTFNKKGNLMFPVQSFMFLQIFEHEDVLLEKVLYKLNTSIDSLTRFNQKLNHIGKKYK